MEEPELVEADFQQYYHIDFGREFLDVDGPRRGFCRFARLLTALPAESRIMKHYAPEASWTWQEEMLSLILQELDALRVLTYNINRKRGSPAEKPLPQVQPDYVRDAKERARNLRVTSSDDIDVEALEAFWSARNPDAHKSNP